MHCSGNCVVSESKAKFVVIAENTLFLQKKSNSSVILDTDDYQKCIFFILSV